MLTKQFSNNSYVYFKFLVSFSLYSTLNKLHFITKLRRTKFFTLTFKYTANVTHLPCNTFHNIYHHIMLFSTKGITQLYDAHSVDSLSTIKLILN